MTTHVVAAAAQRLREKPDLVRKSFIQCGISIAADGSQDDLIKIKDIPSSEIDFSGWETQEDSTINQREEAYMELSTEGDLLQEFHLPGEDYMPRNNYRGLFHKELKELCRQRGLKVSGAKRELIGRLEQEDQRFEQ